MEYLAPLALFLFFLGVITLLGRERGPVRGVLGGATVDQRRVVRGFVGAFLVAWILGMVAIVGPHATTPLLVPAGFLIVGMGVAHGVDYRGLRGALARDPRNFRLATRWAAPVLVLIGLGWAAGGVAATVSGL
jgi:hypothetical protein